MAVSGLFTYEDLYGGKYENYYHRYIPPISSSETLSVLNTTTTTTTTVALIPTSNHEKFVLSTEIESSTKLNKLAEIIPFTYFYWILVVLAIILILTLIIIFICYCRTFFINYKTRR
jgi:hypothetical protein